uniref:Uncharacterized protein n=1 Tax=Glossina brevipalpis TaxID=37001 RepID=A0A1A9WC45_9MUSC
MLPPTISTTLQATNNYKQNHREPLKDFIEENKQQTEEELEQQQQQQQQQLQQPQQRRHHHQPQEIFYKRHQVRNHFKTTFNETLSKLLKTTLKDYVAQYIPRTNNEISANSSHSIDLPTSSSMNPNTSHRNSHYNVVSSDDVTEYIDSVTTINNSLHHHLNVSSTIANKLDISTIITSDTTTTTTTFPTTQTVATIMAGNKNRPTTIIIYPTVSPESIVIPIISCIFGFPILALIVICCLRHRAKMARERDRRRNYDMQDHAVSLVRFSPIHRLNQRSARAVSLRPERSLSQGFTSIDLDTVVEERSDIEQTQTETFNQESPLETASYRISFSGS